MLTRAEAWHPVVAQVARQNSLVNTCRQVYDLLIPTTGYHLPLPGPPTSGIIVRQRSAPDERAMKEISDMKWPIHLFRRSKGTPVTVLMAPPHVGPTLDWSGPEIPLSGHQPIADYLCRLLDEASQRNAGSIRLRFDPGNDRATVQMNTPQGSQQIPAAPGFLWSPLIFLLPKVSSLESCQGVFTDPVQQHRWRFLFTRESGQILLTKLEAEDSQADPGTGL